MPGGGGRQVGACTVDFELEARGGGPPWLLSTTETPRPQNRETLSPSGSLKFSAETKIGEDSRLAG